jgi:hypothetical protein
MAESSLPDQVVPAPNRDSITIVASKRRLAKGGVLLFGQIHQMHDNEHNIVRYQGRGPGMAPCCLFHPLN